MMQIPRKRNRRVPVILKPHWVEAIQLLQDTRRLCQVGSLYLFAVPGKQSHINVWQEGLLKRLLRYFMSYCNLPDDNLVSLHEVFLFWDVS